MRISSESARTRSLVALVVFRDGSVPLCCQEPGKSRMSRTNLAKPSQKASNGWFRKSVRKMMTEVE
jgi:hypothetical protein